jgi:hypothetical protein
MRVRVRVQTCLRTLQFPLSDYAYARSKTAANQRLPQLAAVRFSVARWTSNPCALVRFQPGPPRLPVRDGSAMSREPRVAR